MPVNMQHMARMGGQPFRSRNQTQRSSSRRSSSSSLDLSRIVDNQSVFDQQDGIQYEAQRQLGFANQGSPGYSVGDIEKFRNLAQDGTPDWIPEWSLGAVGALGRLGELIDRPAQALRMITWDALNAFDYDDGHDSLQFSLDDYWDAFAGNDEELIRDNPGIMGDDGQFGFSQMFDLGITIGDNTYSWQQTDTKWARILRGVAAFGGEALYDPINLFTGGLSGAGKKVAVNIAEAGLQEVGLDVLKTMKGLGELSIAGTTKSSFKVTTTNGVTSNMSRRVFGEIQSRAKVIRAADPEKAIDDVLDEAAGFKRTITLPDPNNAKELVEKPLKEIAELTDTPFDDSMGVFSSVTKVKDELGGYKDVWTWYAEIHQEVVGTIARKQFHRDSGIWNDWVDHAHSFENVANSRLMTTTGGITYGLPFGRAATRQAEIPFITQATRGLVSKRTRAMYERLGGRKFDDRIFEKSKNFETDAYRMRIARRTDPSAVQAGNDVAASVVIAAQRAEAAQMNTIMQTLQPHIGIARLATNAHGEVTAAIRLELKRQGKPKKKGGLELEARIMREIQEAEFSGRDIDFSTIELGDFTPSADFEKLAREYTTVLRGVKTQMTQYAAWFVPEIEQAIISGRAYSPLQLTRHGSDLLQKYGTHVGEDGSGSDSFLALIEAFRKAAKEADEDTDWDVAMREVVGALERNARATGILDRDDHLSYLDVVAFFQMVETAAPTAQILPKSIGDAAQFRMRKMGATGMWVFDESGGVASDIIFEDPTILNRKMSALLYAMTEPMAGANAEIDKLRKLTGESLFETDPGTLLDAWIKSTLEAVLERVDYGLLARTGQIDGARYLFDYQSSTKNAAAAGVPDDAIALRDALIEMRTRETDAAMTAQGATVPPPKTVKVRFDTTGQAIPEPVWLDIDEHLLDDVVVGQSIDDLLETSATVARAKADIPGEWRTRIDTVMNEREVSEAEAVQIIMETELVGFATKTKTLHMSMEAALTRRYATLIEEAAAMDDAGSVNVLINSVERDLGAAEAQLSQFYNDFVAQFTEDTPTTAVRNITEADDMSDIISGAQAVLGDAGQEFRTRTIAANKNQINSMEQSSVHAKKLQAEIEVLEEADRIAANIVDGRLPHKTVEVEIGSGGQNGVDLMAVHYANMRGKKTGGRFSTGKRLDDEAGAIDAQYPNAEVEVASTRAEMERLGLKEIEGANDYPTRTMANVDDHDVTVVYFPGVGGGSEGGLKAYGKRSSISGGSADTVWYAWKNSWPEKARGRKRTFTEKDLYNNFREIAEGVWVPNDPDSFHRPVMVVGYVAREHVRPELTGAQHMAVQSWVSRNSVDGKLRVNVAGPRSEQHVRKLYSITDGVFDDTHDEIPAILKATDKQTAEIRFGELAITDEDGNKVVFREAMEPRRQTVEEFVEQFNLYLEWLGHKQGHDRMVGAGNYITVQQVLEWNMDKTQRIEALTSRHLAALREASDEGKQKAVDHAVKQLGEDRVAQVADLSRLADEDFHENLAAVMARHQAEVGVEIVRDLDNRFYGRLSGGSRVEQGAPQVADLGGAVTGTPVQKTLSPNARNERIVRQLATQYGIDTNRETWEIYGDLRALKAERNTPVVEEVPMPWDYVESPAYLDQPSPAWGIDKRGDITGPLVAGEGRLVPIVVYSPEEDAFIREVAAGMAAFKSKDVMTMNIHDIVHKMNTNGSWHDRSMPKGQARLVDEFGYEPPAWQEAYDMQYPSGISGDLANRTEPLESGVERIAQYETVVPAAESVMERIYAFIRTQPDPDLITPQQIIKELFGEESKFARTLDDVFEDYHDELSKQAVQEQVQFDELLEAGRITVERHRDMSNSLNSGLRNALADRRPGATLDQTVYDVMDAYLRGMGMEPKEVDGIFEVLNGRMGVPGTADNAPAYGVVSSGARHDPNWQGAPLEDDYATVQAEAGVGLGSQSIDRQDLFARLGYNPDDEGMDFGEVLVDGRHISDAEVDYLSAVVHRNVGFDVDAPIRVPPHDRMNNKKYYSQDYKPGKYADQTRRQQQGANETGYFDEAGNWQSGMDAGTGKVAVSGHNLDVNEVSPFDKKFDAHDPANVDEFGAPRKTRTDRNVGAMEFEDEIEPDLLNQRQVIAEGEGFTEKLDQAVSPPADQAYLEGAEGLRAGVERLMDMVLDPAPGESVASHMYDTAARAHASVMNDQMTVAFNLVAGSKHLNQIASMSNISVTRARKAWRGYQQTLDPKYLYDPDLLKVLALNRLSINGGSATGKALAQSDEKLMFEAQRALAEASVIPTVKAPVSDDELDKIALWIVDNNTAATTRVMKEFGVGRNKAEGILSALESKGLVGPKVKGKQRTVTGKAEVPKATQDQPMQRGHISLSREEQESLAEAFPTEGLPSHTMERNKLNRAIVATSRAIDEFDAADAARKTSTSPPPQGGEVIPSIKTSLKDEMKQLRDRVRDRKKADRVRGEEDESLGAYEVRNLEDSEIAGRISDINDMLKAIEARSKGKPVKLHDSLKSEINQMMADLKPGGEERMARLAAVNAELRKMRSDSQFETHMAVDDIYEDGNTFAHRFEQLEAERDLLEAERAAGGVDEIKLPTQATEVDVPHPDSIPGGIDTGYHLELKELDDQRSKLKFKKDWESEKYPEARQEITDNLAARKEVTDAAFQEQLAAGGVIDSHLIPTADDWDALPDDQLLVVYHATDPQTAHKMRNEGLKGDDKAFTAEKDQRWEAGLTPPGLYVSSHYDVGGMYGGDRRTVVALEVRKDQLVSPREMTHLVGRDDVFSGLTTPRIGALLEGDVNAVGGDTMFKYTPQLVNHKKINDLYIDMETVPMSRIVEVENEIDEFYERSLAAVREVQGRNKTRDAADGEFEELMKRKDDAAHLRRAFQQFMGLADYEQTPFFKKYLVRVADRLKETAEPAPAPAAAAPTTDPSIDALLGSKVRDINTAGDPFYGDQPLLGELELTIDRAQKSYDGSLSMTDGDPEELAALNRMKAEWKERTGKVWDPDADHSIGPKEELADVIPITKDAGIDELIAGKAARPVVDTTPTERIAPTTPEPADYAAQAERKKRLELLEGIRDRDRTPNPVTDEAIVADVTRTVTPHQPIHTRPAHTPVHVEPKADKVADLIDAGAVYVGRGVPVSRRQPVIEVSTHGDKFSKQFSAFNAKLDGKSIEHIYQVEIKGYPTIAAGKKKGSINPDVPDEKLSELYQELWNRWAQENPELIRQLADRVHKTGARLNDKFAGDSVNTQDKALSRIIEQLNVEGAAPSKKLADGVTVDNGWANSVLANPYVPVGTNFAAGTKQEFLVIEDLSGGVLAAGKDTNLEGGINPSMAVPFVHVSNELVSASMYHDLLWQSIQHSPAVRKYVRDLHGKTLVDWSNKKQSLPNSVRILSEAADWLYYGMDGVPPNKYKSAEALPISARQELIVNEALEVRKTMQAHHSTVMDQAERAASPLDQQAFVHDMTPEELFTNVIADDPTAALPKQRHALVAMNIAAQAIHGPDAKVTVHRATAQSVADGTRIGGKRVTHTPSYVRVRTPGDDIVGVQTQLARNNPELEFHTLVEDVQSGRLSEAEAMEQGLDMVVQAAAIQTKLDGAAERMAKQLAEPVEGTPTPTPVQVAEVEATVKDFKQLLNHINKAISTGDSAKLRRFLGVDDDFNMNATPEWERLDKALSSGLTPDEEARVRFWIEAATAAHWDWGSQHQWMQAWQEMRLPKDGPRIPTPVGRARQRKDGLSKVADEAIATDNKAAGRTGHELDITSSQHKRGMLYVDQLIRYLEQYIDTFDAVSRVDGKVPFKEADIDAKVQLSIKDSRVQGVGGKGSIFNTDEPETFENLIDHLFHATDKLYVSEYLNEMVNAKELQELDIRTLRKLHDTFQAMRKKDHPGWWATSPRGGRIDSSTYGLGGLMSNHFIDPMVGAEMQASQKRLAAMLSHQGQTAVLEGAQRLQDWWKRAATLPKITFHARNLIGGMWNNMMIGVNVGHHLAVAPDVHKYLKAQRKYSLLNWDPDEAGDAWEQVVLSQVSEKNRDMFRQAGKMNIFESSFAQTFDRQDLRHGKWDYVNPIQSNFAGYRIGGDMMAEVEGVLRMAAFSKYFDPQYPIISGARATTMTNMVHFDYSATTEMEDRIKHFVPFYVWTRNNIPLQMRMLLQQPRWINMYEKARRNWNQTAGEDDSRAAGSGWVIPGIRRENENGFAQMVWNPDLPFNDLLQLPLFAGRESVDIAGIQTPIGNEVGNWAEWAEFITGMTGPILQMPMDMAEEQKRAASPGYAGSVAPVGINQVAYILGLGETTPQGDVLLPKFVSSTIMQAFPFWYEYADLAGIPANSPYRLANQGVLPGEEHDTNPFKSATVSISKLATGFGFRWYTQKDVFFEDLEIERYLTEMDRRRRIMSSEPAP